MCVSEGNTEEEKSSVFGNGGFGGFFSSTPHCVAESLPPDISNIRQSEQDFISGTECV